MSQKSYILFKCFCKINAKVFRICEFNLATRSGRSVQHYVIKFVSHLRQVGGFLQAFRFPPPIKLKLTAIAITEILLKVALHSKPI